MKPDNRTPVNVKVVVRCRPSEQTDPGNYSLEIRESRREVIVHSKIRRQNEPSAKSYTFDGVCGPNTDQEDLFDGQIVPLVEEVLQGFNCTIFAYGQTGTGKTYTMEGEWSKNLGSEPTTPTLPQAGISMPASSADGERGTGTLTPNSHYNTFKLPKGVGIIPRSVGLIFRRLNLLNCESGLKVSFLEIYNEELIDLLQPAGTEKQTLRIYESGNHLTKGLAVKGLMEVPVATLPEVYSVMANATRKRKTAETLLNRQSSRSHSIFTITVTIKEISSEGEDVIRIGKLNLVDLAGSENIQRSGSSLSQIRTKEACIINQSLVALGRVINSLVSQSGGGGGSSISVSGQSGNSGYIPYRDSKLTRLLQDSLGGHTKTCIIATISCAGIAVEETLSTLDYAYRAKHIKNIPQINQRMSQKFIVKELTVELEKLRKDLLIARERSGEVHLTNEDYTLMEADLTQYQEMKRVHAALELRAEELIAEIEKLREVSAQFEEMKVVYFDLVAEFDDLREKHADQATMLRVEQYLTDVLHSLNTKFSDRIEYYYKSLLSKIENSFQNYDQILQSILRDHLAIIDQIKPSEVDQNNKLMLSEYILDSYNKKIPGYRNFLSKEFRKLLGMISTVDSNDLHTRVSTAGARCASSFNETMNGFRRRVDDMLSTFADSVTGCVEYMLARLDAQKYGMKEFADKSAKLSQKLLEASESFCCSYKNHIISIDSKIMDPAHSSKFDYDHQNVVDGHLTPPARSPAPASDFRYQLTKQLEEYLESEVKTAVRKIVDDNVQRLVVTMHAQHKSFDETSLEPFVRTIQSLNAEQTASVAACLGVCEAERTRARDELTRFSQMDGLKNDVIQEIGNADDALKDVVQNAFTAINAGARECTHLLVKRKGVMEEQVKNTLLPTIEALLSEEDVPKALQQMQVEKQDLNEQLAGTLKTAQTGLVRYISGSRAELVQAHNQLYRNHPAPALMPPKCNGLEALRLMIAAGTGSTGDAQWDELLAHNERENEDGNRPTQVGAGEASSALGDQGEGGVAGQRRSSVKADRLSFVGKPEVGSWPMEEGCGLAKEALDSMTDENIGGSPAS